MGDEQVLDFLGRDVLPAADDDVLQPVGDRQVPVGVEPSDVSGPEPAAGQERRGVQRGVGVAGEELRAATEDLASQDVSGQRQLVYLSVLPRWKRRRPSTVPEC
jgi:hypothetical protein